MPSKAVLARCQSRKLAGEIAKRGMPGNDVCGGVWKRRTSRPGSSKGSGRRSTALTMLKTAVVAPMPSASTAMTAAANDGARRMVRSARRRSVARERMSGSFCAGCRASAGWMADAGGRQAHRSAWRQYQRRAAAGEAAARARNSSSRSPATKSCHSAGRRQARRRSAARGGRGIISGPGAGRGRRPSSARCGRPGGWRRRRRA